MRQHIIKFLILSLILMGRGNVSAAHDVASSIITADKFAVGKNGRSIVLPVTFNGRSLHFLLDTGAGKTCFDKSLVSELGTRIGTDTLKTPSGLQTTELFACPESYVGNLPLHSVKTVGCVDLVPIRYATGLAIDGLIGADFCIGKLMEIDFDAGTVVFDTSPSTKLAESDEFQQLPVSIINGVPQITIELTGGKQAQVVVDTGANRTTLRADIFDELVNELAIKTMGNQRAASLGGIHESRFGTLAVMKLGNQPIENVVVDGDGLSLLALDQLARFQLRLDLQNNQLSLRKGKRFSQPAPDATSGMSIIQDHGMKRVIRVKDNGSAARAGIQRGDQLIKIDGCDATNIDMFTLREILTHAPGKVVLVEVKRNQRNQSFKLVLSANGT